MQFQAPHVAKLKDEGLNTRINMENPYGILEGNLDVSCEVGIILPTYCEAANIEKMIEEIEKLNLDASILVIDDSSPDGTADIVRDLQRKYDKCLLFTRPTKLGLGTAITDGFKIFLLLKNPPKYVVTMDADFSHNPKYVPSLLLSAKKCKGVVIGSRYCEGGGVANWNPLRLLISRVANILASFIVRANIRDYTSGLRCYPFSFVRNVINNLHCQTYEIQIEIIRQSRLQKLNLREIPILFTNRKKGKSKLAFTEVQGFISYIVRAIVNNRTAN